MLESGRPVNQRYDVLLVSMVRWQRMDTMFIPAQSFTTMSILQYPHHPSRHLFFVYYQWGSIINGGTIPKPSRTNMGGGFQKCGSEFKYQTRSVPVSGQYIKENKYVVACMGRNINEWTQDVSLNSPSPQQCQHITARSALWLTKCTVPVAGVALPFDCLFYWVKEDVVGNTCSGSDSLCFLSFYNSHIRAVSRPVEPKRVYLITWFPRRETPKKRDNCNSL